MDMIEEIKKQLIKSLPSYERKNALMNEILLAAAIKFDSLTTDQNENEYELFIDTAVKSLFIHARDLGISIGSGLTLAEQRELITAYYRATFEQTNDETIKSVASSFSGGKVELNPTNKDGVFEIKFVDVLGIPSNMEGLKSALNVIIPAHLELVYKFSYLLIRDVDQMTLNDLETIPLNQFAGGEN